MIDNIKSGEEAPEKLKFLFQSKHNGNFEIEVQVFNGSILYALETAWMAAFDYYCPEQKDLVIRQLRRKNSYVKTFKERAEVVIRFITMDKRREEVFVTPSLIHPSH